MAAAEKLFRSSIWFWPIHWVSRPLLVHIFLLKILAAIRLQMRGDEICYAVASRSASCVSRVCNVWPIHDNYIHDNYVVHP